MVSGGIALLASLAADPGPLRRRTIVALAMAGLFAGAGQVGRVREWIEGHMKRIRIYETSHCDVPIEVLLGGRPGSGARPRPGGDAPSDTAAHDHGGNPDHGGQFATWSYESDRPLSLEALNEMIRNELPGTVYRCKGLIYVSEIPDERVILQVVGRRAEVATGGEWGEQPPRTRIVAIGAPEGFDPDELQRRFDGCLSKSPSGA